MSDQVLDPFEGDVPVNPYNLIEAVNSASADAQRGGAIALALMAYLAIAVASVGHKDLLLGKDVVWPALQVGLELRTFFVAVPVVLLIAHVALLLRHALLARKVLEFDRSLRDLEATDAPRHPLRLELNAYAFSQMLAGPERARLIGLLIHAKSWATLIAVPLLLLLFIQVAFLPYHDVAITWLHRVVVLLDVGIVSTLGVFLVRTDTTLKNAVRSTLAMRSAQIPATAALLAAVILFSLMAATVPGETLDRMTPRLPGWGRAIVSSVLPGGGDPLSDSAFGFRRNLVVMDTTLADHKNLSDGQPSLNLRGRDLRFVRLDRSHMPRADLSGADLEGAILSGANLVGAAFACLDPQAQQAGNRAGAGCASLKGATLIGVEATGARFSGADLTGANLSGAQLDDADLSEAILTGATLSQPPGSDKGNDKGSDKPAGDRGGRDKAGQATTGSQSPATPSARANGDGPPAVPQSVPVPVPAGGPNQASPGAGGPANDGRGNDGRGAGDGAGGR